MALFFENLDDRTRQLMLDEMEYDIANNQLHISPFLSGQGERDYANLLREALQSGTDETLAQSLREHRRILRTLPRRNLPEAIRLPRPPRTPRKYWPRANSIVTIFAGWLGVRSRMAFRSWLCIGQSRSATPDRNQRPAWKLPSLRRNCSRICDPIPATNGPTLGVPSGPNSGLSVRLP